MEDKYILIPVKDFESIRPESYHKRPTSYKAKILSISKQISLSESDIEKKADENFPDDTWGRRIYAQALKDLKENNHAK